jgi:hypothetical protein
VGEADRGEVREERVLRHPQRLRGLLGVFHRAGQPGHAERVGRLLADPHEQLAGGAQLLDGDRDLADR